MIKIFLLFFLITTLLGSPPIIEESNNGQETSNKNKEFIYTGQFECNGWHPNNLTYYLRSCVLKTERKRCNFNLSFRNAIFQSTCYEEKLVCENEEEKILPTDGNFTIKTEFDKINNEKNNEGNNQEKEVIKYDLLISYKCCDKKINYRYDVTDHVKKLKSNTQGQDPTVHNLGKIDVICSEKKSNSNSDDGDYYST